MEIKGLKIKNQDQLIDAIIELVDGVMVVSPKEEKVDITKFKDVYDRFCEMVRQG